MSCDLPAGDHTLTYTPASGPGVAAWKVVADARFDVVEYGSGNPETTGTFHVLSPTSVSERYRLIGRTADGQLWSYDGSGSASRPFLERELFGDGWQQYTAATALSRVTVHETGDAVARDDAGTLWYYRGTGSLVDWGWKPRAMVGEGWNTYKSIVGRET